jgi:HEAT repeat protein
MTLRRFFFFEFELGQDFHDPVATLNRAIEAEDQLRRELESEAASDEALPDLAVAVEDLEGLLFFQLGMKRADVDVSLAHVGRQLDGGDGDEEPLQIEGLAHAGGEFLAENLGHADGSAGGHKGNVDETGRGCNLRRMPPSAGYCPPQEFSLRGMARCRLMTVFMNKCFWRLVLVIGTTMILAGCGNKETKEALEKSATLEDQKQYQEANDILVEALQAREAKIRADAGAPADQAASDTITKQVGSDSEILKMERAQIPLYLHMERADMATAVYTDILSGNPGDSVVVDILHDKDPLMRTGAVRILGLMGKPDAIDALVGATKDPDQDVRRSAVAALGSIKDPATVEPLIDALKDSYWFARSEAANALGQEHDGRAVKPLLDAVTDSDDTVESSAETALLFLSKGPDAVAPPNDLAGRLNDPNPKVVLISAVCLAMLKDSRAVPVLLKLVASPDLTTRLDAVKGLGEAGDPSVIPTLRQTLKDPDVNMRGWSIIGLGNLKDEGSLDDLRAIAADDSEPSTIKAAAEAAINHIDPAANPSASSATLPSGP